MPLFRLRLNFELRHQCKLWEEALAQWFGFEFTDPSIQKSYNTSSSQANLFLIQSAAKLRTTVRAALKEPPRVCRAQPAEYAYVNILRS